MVTICITIVVSINLLCKLIKWLIKSKNEKLLAEEKYRREAELEKLRMEIARKESKDRYDAAWRCIEHSWRDKMPEDDSNAEAAWLYIHNMWIESQKKK